MISTTPLENECFYHVYNRGNNGELIFKEHDNYNYFLKLLARYILHVADVYAYNLLNNHFHLLVKIKDFENIKAEQAFSNLFNAYVKAFNKKYNRTGKLFEERFKRKKISDDFYLTEIIYYIHLNAQKHKLISDFRDYQYCSYKSILSLQKTRQQRE
ncbi:MAG: transposase [Bacteroidota bacterium]